MSAARPIEEVWPALTPREATFVEAVAAGGMTYAAAARAAGYSAVRAKATGSELAHRPAVQAAIRRRWTELAAENGYDAHRVHHELSLLAFSDVAHFTVDPETGDVAATPDAPAGATRALAKVKKRIRHQTKDGETTTIIDTEFALWPKPEALLKAGTHLGAFDDARLDGEQLRDLLGALVGSTMERVRAMLPPDAAESLLEALGEDWRRLLLQEQPLLLEGARPPAPEGGA